MFGIRRVHKQIEDLRLAKREFLSDNPLTEAIDVGEIKINTSITRAMYDPYSLVYLDTTKLIDPETNLYYYNAGFYENSATTYRMFYRCGKNPKGWEDRVATCLLDRDFNILPETNKYIDMYSCWKETTRGSLKFKEMIPFKFKNGVHVEDPRAIRHESNWFLFYTDGITMGVAKLDDDCNTIYSHYLSVPKDAFNIQTDGREKNWIPIEFKDGQLYVLYSENPKTIFKYKDDETCLTLMRTVSSSDILTWNHGHIRGGCPPVPYKSDKYIWFFHSVKNLPTYVSEYSRVYSIGAYITSNKYPYDALKITTLPVLLGWPSHAVSNLLLQDNVVFPCGAVKIDEHTYVICMGVNDYKIAYLTVKITDLLWEDVKPSTVKFVKNAF